MLKVETEYHAGRKRPTNYAKLIMYTFSNCLIHIYIYCLARASNISNRMTLFPFFSSTFHYIRKKKKKITLLICEEKKLWQNLHESCYVNRSLGFLPWLSKYMQLSYDDGCNPSDQPHETRLESAYILFPW